MTVKVLMPQLGESITEGTIVRWNKKVGDPVDRDEPLLEISTDKVDAEIPSPVSGVLVDIKATNGETVSVDSIVALIDQSEKTTSADSRRASQIVTESPSEPIRETRNTAVEERPENHLTEHLSPVVRKLAQDHDIDTSKITGTGAKGRITKDDVLTHIAQSSSPVDRVERMNVMRRTIAERMVVSRRTSAHVHTVFEVDFCEVERLRNQYKQSYQDKGTRLTYLSFVAKAVVDSIPEVPVINASLKGEEVVYKRDVNLGIAVALEEGLIVPVIKQAQSCNLAELSQAVGDLAERARSRTLTPSDVEGGTFTITNPGKFGSVFAMPIINQPLLAILCLGAVEQRAVVIDQTVAARYRAFLTLGFDHRIIDGAIADQFMAAVKLNLEKFNEDLL